MRPRDEAEASMRKSMRMLIAAAFGCALVGTAITANLRGLPAVAVASLLCGGSLALALLAGAAWVTAQRQARLYRGERDLFLECNDAQSESALRQSRASRPWWLRRAMARAIFGHRLLVGDVVQVRSLNDIKATLDADGCLDGLPFMDEMAPACGQRFRVYRVIDKVYDYGRSRLMRRLDDCVLLLEQRCDGSAHDACEAACYVIWKVQWLAVPGAVSVGIAELPAAGSSALASPERRLRQGCQYTQLSAASRPMHPASLHGLLGPVVVGNIGVRAFLTALGTRAFNAFQAWRGGAPYPAKPTPSDDKSIRGQPLQSGDWVRIKLPHELARAMDRNSKNRGLWFDRDMLKHAGQRYRVRGRIDKIIDVNSGKIMAMKTPCIALEGVHYSGEFQGFGEQHDYLYWREAWLEPAGPNEPRRD